MKKIRFKKSTIATNSALAVVIGVGCESTSDLVETCMPANAENEHPVYRGADDLVISSHLNINIFKGDSFELYDNRYEYDEDKRTLSFRIFDNITHNKLTTDEINCTAYTVEDISKEEFEIIDSI